MQLCYTDLKSGIKGAELTQQYKLEMQQYIAYRIVLRQYCCIDTKSNRIDISHIVIYRHTMAC